MFALFTQPDTILPLSQGNCQIQSAKIVTGVVLPKIELQKLSNETGLSIPVCHFPPGTSKWNKIEHRLFSFISQNRRGKPLISHEVIVSLISSTTTKTGLNVECGIDPNSYPKGIKVSDKELKAVNLLKDSFHGEWNYTIKPNVT